MVPAAAQESEPDILEPNDNREQAVDVELYTSYWVSLYPEGDQDHFSFTLNKTMAVQPEATGASQGISWEILDEKGNPVGNRFPVILSAGRYFARLTGYASPEAFMIKIRAVPETVLSKIPPLLKPGQPYLISLSAPGATDSFKVRAGHTGYLTLQSFQLKDGLVQFTCNKDGREHRGNPLVIPVKKGEIISAGAYATGQYNPGTPFTLFLAGSEWLDSYEVNDSIPAATRIDKSDPAYFSIYPSGDTDWFKVKVTHPGKIFASLSFAFSSGSLVNRFPFTIELYDEKRNSAGTFGYRYTGAGYIYGSTYLREPGSYYMKIFSNDDLSEEHLLRMQLFGNVSGNSGETAFKDIYFIGFELDTSANMALEALAESQGANVTMVDSTGSLQESLYAIFEDAQKRKRSGDWLWWGTAILLAGGAGFWVYRNRKK